MNATAEQQLGALLDPHANRRALQSFAEAVRHTACAACGKPALSSENEVLLKFKEWFGKSGNATVNISSVFSCKTSFCSAGTCLGCGANVSDPKQITKLDNGCILSWCCARGRLALIWILLCGYDRRRTVKQKRDNYFKSPIKPAGSAAKGAGVGFDSDYPSYSSLKSKAVKFGKYGTLPGTSVDPNSHVPSPGEAAEDEITGRLMTCLHALLPSLVAEEVSEFDIEPPNVLGALLMQSNILSKIAELLRNDSLEDATKRMGLYNATLNVVSKLGSHYATANATIHRARQEQDGGPDILSISFASSTDRECKFEETQSLASCLRNFDKQSKNMLANSRAHPQAFAAADSKKMLCLCQKVSDLADFLLANATPAPQQGEAASAKDDWQSDLALLGLPDGDILSRQSYAREAATAQNQALNRMRSLSLQLNSLTTSLPPGIFVRHCASRLDVMKILIVGPKGTPYENGLFEFDLFCPSTFPNSPPSMNFRTTGGGRVRFNPNLYNCGKGASLI